jgi:hypothetical protein
MEDIYFQTCKLYWKISIILIKLIYRYGSNLDIIDRLIS